MRISFGGGSGRGPRISFNLGPIGSFIGFIIFAIIGALLTLISLIGGINFILLLIGVLFCVVGVFGCISSKKRMNNGE